MSESSLTFLSHADTRGGGGASIRPATYVTHNLCARRRRNKRKNVTALLRGKTLTHRELLEPNKLTLESEQIKGEELVICSQYSIFTHNIYSFGCLGTLRTAV